MLLRTDSSTSFLDSPGGPRPQEARRCSLDSQGRALVAGAVTQNGKLRGYVLAREVDVKGPVLFEHWHPGIGPSEALGIGRDSFDRIFPAGYITVNGETQAQITLIHG
jgi:hypothetical protein